MLNSSYILKRISPYLNKNREISEFEFVSLFSNLSRQEQYEVIRIMILNDIDYVDEKSEEANAYSAFENQYQITTSYHDHNRLLHLSNEELCVMAQHGDSAARAAIVEKNKKFVYQIALKLFRQNRRTCMTLEDFFQYGIFGMLKAIERYDVKLDCKFTTYCWHWVKQAITRSVIDFGFTVRLPVHMFERLNKIIAYRERYPLANRDELVKVISRKEGLSVNQVNYCLALSDIYLNTASLNTLVGEEQDVELQDVLSDDGPSVEELIIQRDIRTRIDNALETISDREAYVLDQRFGLVSRVPKTLDEVGKSMHVTRERVRQIESKAMKKMRHPSRIKKLRSFIREE